MRKRTMRGLTHDLPRLLEEFAEAIRRLPELLNRVEPAGSKR